MYISRKSISVFLFTIGKLSGLILIKSREKFVQLDQLNSGISKHKEIKSNTNSYYTNNNLSYCSNSYIPLYILDLGEKKNKILEKTINNIFGNLDII
jgi:lipid II:glycine glycyltransferase (peptidoglycan interpeptide bridge formation enzyme)